MAGFDTNFYETSPEDLVDSTIFLVVLTTTNVTTLGNIEPDFFMFAMCFHIVNFVKPQKACRAQNLDYFAPDRGAGIFKILQDP